MNLTNDHRVAITTTVLDYAQQRRARAHAATTGAADRERGLYTADLMEAAVAPVLNGEGTRRQMELVLNTLGLAMADGKDLEQAAEAVALMYMPAWED